MTYSHGINLRENPTSLPQPDEAYSAVQVVFGTAPINLAENPYGAANKPILVKSFDEAKRKLGYSDDWEKYTLCQSMDASFKVFKVAPVVFINVLDPAVHKKSEADVSVQVTDKQATINQEGVLLSSLVVKSSDGVTTYEEDNDYLAAFNEKGEVIISLLGSISDTTLTLNFDKVDPTAVTTADIIGGYDSQTETHKGIELTSTVYPTLGIIPNLLLAPGWSHNPEVGAILVAKSERINGCFNAENILDLQGKTKEEALSKKVEADYIDKSSFICWPKAKIGEKVYWYSAILGASIGRTDADNDGIPFKSPSNKRIPLSAMVNEDGKEIFLDQLQGNVLNAKGIVTAVSMKGWRVWGNNTAHFDADVPGIHDPKDRYIPVRRMFNWWGNSFIENYFDKVDDPANYRLIESLVDSENIRANGYQASGQIAGAKIEFRQSENPIEQILNGRIQFIQKVAFFTPAESIENVLEFDPTILSESFTGGNA